MVARSVVPFRGAPARLLAALVVTLIAGPAIAGTPSVQWPGPAPCNTSLQACIVATAAGSDIVIVQTTPIDETLNIQNRSVTLRAADGQRARFAPGRNLFVGVAPISADVEVTLDGIDLVDGMLSVSFNNAGQGSFTLRNLRLGASASGSIGGELRLRAIDGTVQARIEGNHIEGRPLAASGLLAIDAEGAELDARVYENTITRTDFSGSGSGIRINALGGASGTTRLHANHLRGGFQGAAILVNEGGDGVLPSDYAVRLLNNVVVGAVTDEPVVGNIVDGIVLRVRDGRIHGVAINNTVTAVADGIAARHALAGATAGRVEGLIANNLVIAHRGLVLSADLAAVPSNHHNLLNATLNEATLGANTITAPARVQSLDAPRLRADSPAIAAADTTSLGLALLLNGLPSTDADGLRRIKGTVPDAADIGAYEFGDVAFSAVTRPVTIDDHVGVVAHPALDGTPLANLLLTPDGSSGLALPYAIGVYYRSLSAQWAAFLQDTGATLPPHARFAAFVPAPGSGLFRHEATGANTDGKFTRIENSALDGIADRIVLVTQNWSIDNTYNDHPVGLLYNGTNWFIDNLDGATMPIGAGFNVYVQPPSANAFRVPAPEGATQIPLRHPLLDGNPCARPQVTRQYNSTFTPGHFQLLYVDGGWRVDTFGAPVTGITAFHVVVVPEQTETCEGRVFRDGFESPPAAE